MKLNVDLDHNTTDVLMKHANSQGMSLSTYLKVLATEKAKQINLNTIEVYNGRHSKELKNI